MRDFLDAASPAMAAFGPLMIALAIDASHLLQTMLALLGAMMVSLVLVTVLLKLRRIERRMDAPVSGPKLLG